MQRTRIKICGLTRIDDALAAARAGVDAIGLVFWARSPRAVTHDHARRIALALPPFVTRVALFVDPQPAEVQSVLARVPVDLLQFHGEEPDDFCAAFDRPFVKAVRVAAGADPTHLLEYARGYPRAQAILLDTLKPRGLPGGTGTVFDWAVVPSGLPKPLILSGGLNPDNVGRAVRQVRPWAVDTSTGVEEVGADGAPRNGLKDARRIAAFVRGVHDADV